MEESIVAIVQSLTDECNARGIDATSALIAYTVRSIISTNIDQFQGDVSQPLTEDKCDALKVEALEKLMNPKSLPMLTIRMQVDMDLGLAQSEKSQKQREEREAEQLNAIENELISTRARSSTALESLYRKIVSYTIIASKWGSPNDPQCVRQATAALEQVYPSAELPKLLSMPDNEKRAHLKENAKLVLGVRVFQTFGGDMADPATNLRLEVPKKLDALQSRIRTSIEGINSIILQYNELLKDDTKDPDSEQMRNLIDELANRQQFLFFYELLQARLNELLKTVEQSSEEFDKIIETLRGMMELGDAPQNKAFPNFTAIAKVWMDFKKSEESIKSFELLLARLRKHRDTFTYSIKEGAESPGASATITQSTSGVGQFGEVDVEDKPKEVIPKESEVMADDGEPILIQREQDGEFAFNGFCPVTLVQRDGLLLPGDVVLGSVKWERRYYAFVDQDKRALFQRDPARWHNDAIEVAKRHPELIPLLALQSEFPTLQAPKMPVKAKMPEPPNAKMRNVAVETETHPIESYIDRTYHWNQWELMKRKKILKGLENKRTRSAQTDISHYKRESVAQTVDMVNRGEQTMIDSGVAMPRTVRYIAGLRGDTCTKTQVVSLTLDIA